MLVLANRWIRILGVLAVAVVVLQPIPTAHAADGLEIELTSHSSGPALENGLYAPNPFPISVRVANNGPDLASDVAVEISFAGPISVPAGQEIINLGAIVPGSRNVSWSATAELQQTSIVVPATVTVTSSTYPTVTLDVDFQLQGTDDAPMPTSSFATATRERVALWDGASWTDITGSWIDASDFVAIEGMWNIGDALYTVTLHTLADPGPNNRGFGSELWRYEAAAGWQQVGLFPTVDPRQYRVNDLVEFGGELHALVSSQLPLAQAPWSSSHQIHVYRYSASAWTEVANVASDFVRWSAGASFDINGTERIVGSTSRTLYASQNYPLRFWSYTEAGGLAEGTWADAGTGCRIGIDISDFAQLDTYVFAGYSSGECVARTSNGVHWEAVGMPPIGDPWSDLREVEAGDGVLYIYADSDWDGTPYYNALWTLDDTGYHEGFVADGGNVELVFRSMIYDEERLVLGADRLWSSLNGDSLYLLESQPPISGTFEHMVLLSPAGDKGLQIELSGPTELELDRFTYVDNPMTVLATVENTGNDTATDVAVTLDLPPGLEVVTGDNPRTITSILPGVSAGVVWTVNAVDQQETTVLSYSATAAVDGVADAIATPIDLTVPGLRPVDVTITVTRLVNEGDAPDALGGTGDFYVLTTIDDVAQDRGNQASGDDVDMFSTFSEPVPVGAQWVPVVVEVWDDDGINPDDVIDVNPASDQTAVTIEVSPTTGSWRGDVPYPRTFTTGDASLRAQMQFDISILSANGDLDHDGLLDGWEIRGLDADADGAIDVPIHTYGADPRHKDLFVELDIQERPGTYSGVNSLAPVIEAFALAPVDAGGWSNPDQLPGINLWIDAGSKYDANLTNPNPAITDEGIGGNALPANTAIGPLDTVFYEMKALNFEPERRWIFRYAIAAEHHEGFGGGRAEIGGNDFADYNNTGATFMHELGHTLGLLHGGFEGHNYKPNYLSIMNYSFSGYGLETTAGVRPLDYSPPRYANGTRSAVLPTLSELALIESDALDLSNTEYMTRYEDLDDNQVSVAVAGQAYGSDSGIDWNQTGLIDPDAVATQIDAESHFSSLEGHDDWYAISLPFRHSGDSANAPINPTVEPEPTTEEIDEYERGFNATDLTVSLLGLPASVAPGDTLDLTVRTENDGPNSTTGLRTTVAIPDGVVAVFGPGCVENSGSVECEVDRLSQPGVAGQDSHWDVAVSLQVSADYLELHGDTLPLQATVENLAGDDPNSDNDTATSGIGIEVQADLAFASLIVEGIPAEALAGVPVQVTVTSLIDNLAPDQPVDAAVTVAATGLVGLALTPDGDVSEITAVAGSTEISWPALLECTSAGDHTLLLSGEVAPANAHDTDTNPDNNVAEAAVPVVCGDLPTLSVSDASVVEGDVATVGMDFTVELSRPVPVPVTFSVATEDGSASAVDDYLAVSGPVTIAENETTAVITVAVVGDEVFEGDETLLLTVSEATNATIVSSPATGTIIDDDAATPQALYADLVISIDVLQQQGLPAYYANLLRRIVDLSSRAYVQGRTFRAISWLRVFDTTTGFLVRFGSIEPEDGAELAAQSAALVVAIRAE